VCGIVGWVGSRNASDLSEMVDALRHRGPDEVGSWVGDGAALAIARLAIVDVANGHQPVFSKNRSVVAVCNGEIYNHHELRTLLIEGGASLRSQSDVELIPHLYEIYGLDFVRHLRGMFSIALWDMARERLVLARDRIGKKPLWFVHQDRELVFGSEYRAIRASGWRASVDFTALDHVLAYGYVPVTCGALQGLQAVEPGHITVLESGTLTSHPYWSWTSCLSDYADNATEEGLEVVLKEAIKIRIPSERSFGTFLSGGIDSTLVTALATEVHDQPIQTFTIGFETPTFDESLYAQRIADYLGTHHTSLVANPDPTDFLPYLARSFDQPFADSSAVPTLLLSSLASKHVTVALSGDGGDEVFGGYRRYVAVPKLQQLNALLEFLPFRFGGLANSLRKRGYRSAARILDQLKPEPNMGSRYSDVMQLTPPSLRLQLWRSEIRPLAGYPEKSFLDEWNRIHEVSALAHMQAMDFRTYLPGDLLVKADIASMARSLEVRSPLLDQEVIALAAQMPMRDLIDGQTTKAVLRRILCKRIPTQLFERPKMGFGIPRAAWIRGSWRSTVRDVLISPTTRDRGWFDVASIETLLAEHDRGLDRDDVIWPLLVIEMWAREWIDSSIS